MLKPVKEKYRASTEKKVKSITKQMNEAAIDVNGTKNYEKTKDWYSIVRPLILPFIIDRQKKYKRYRQHKKSVVKKKAYKDALKSEKAALKREADIFFKAKLLELQSCINVNNMLEYKIILRSFGLEKKSTPPQAVNDLEQNMLTDVNQIQARWVQHFQQLLNKKVTVDPEIIEKLDQYATDFSLQEEPTMKEMKKAVSTLKKNKAMGEDLASIAVIELLVKQEPETMLQLFCNIWRERKIPQDWKDIDIIVVFKNKGSKFDPNNYRGLALISQFGKILAKIIDTRLQDYCERVGINDTANQFGFRRGKGIQEILFAARRMQEMANKLGVDLFWAFMDLKKAYDTVHRPTLWKVLSKCGIPQHLIDIIEDWHTGMQACIKMNDVRTEKNNIEVGLKTGRCHVPNFIQYIFQYGYASYEETAKGKV